MFGGFGGVEEASRHQEERQNEDAADSGAESTFYFRDGPFVVAGKLPSGGCINAVSSISAARPPNRTGCGAEFTRSATGHGRKAAVLNAVEFMYTNG